MDVNYWLIGIVGVIVLVLMIWLVKRDRKDEKDFEREIIKSEMNPEVQKDAKTKKDNLE